MEVGQVVEKKNQHMLDVAGLIIPLSTGRRVPRLREVN